MESLDITQTYQILIRYNGHLVNCLINQLTINRIVVTTEVPVYAPTPGQIGTIYDDQTIMVGGIIILQ